MSDLGAEFPEKLQFLFWQARYKVARGGRGSAKSWSFARALLILGVTKRLRILCAREVQESIKQSVHKLLRDQIEKMGITSHYRVLETEIRGRNGTEFAFTGLSSLTVDTIKSFEGYDICWVEEGQTISKRSWDILIPTIRKDGSEIWISYNPDLETDETHQRFTVNRPPDCVNVEMNWRDNPWFNAVLEQERQHCKLTDPDGYDNIWEGKCRPAVEGAIFYKQIQEAELQNRICDVHHDKLLRVHPVVDIGFNDDTSIGLFQINGSEYRLIDYIEGHMRTWDDYSKEMKDKKYSWGKLWLPHDGYSKRIESKGLSSADILKGLGWEVPDRDEVVEMGVEEGIKLTRMRFSQLYIDKTKCKAFVDHVKRYRRHINKQTEAAGTPVHDDHCHAGDMLRYFMVNCHQMTNGPSSAPIGQKQSVDFYYG